jgi:arginine N-succinyltransferase
MVIIRPVTPSDIDALLELASHAGVGLTNLPKDRALLTKRINHSVASFKNIPAEHPGGESYLFIMEDLDARRIVGSCSIVAKVGGYQPFYEYKIETTVFESKIINVRKEIPILSLHETHDGPCEVGGLFLHRDYRHSGNGRFLQLCRFLFVAEFPHAFESTVISEFRGVLDEHGHSPFWDALGYHFFGIGFAEADRLSVVNKKFIAELMPRHPIYIPLLPRSAQDVIGKPHPESERAVKNLVAEGFAFADMVDIFDAGPVYSCPREQIRTVRQSQRAIVAAATDAPIEPPMYMIATTTADFRATRSVLEQTPEGVRIPSSTARALDVRIGDPVRYVEFPTSKHHDAA